MTITMAANPDHWSEAELGDLVVLSSGGTPNRETEAFWGGDLPWVTARDLKVFELYDAIQSLSDQGAEQAKIAPKGALLVLVRGMTLFKDFPVSILNREMSFNQDIKALVAADDIDPYFLGHQLTARKRWVMRLVDSAGHGTGRLDTDQLKSLPIRYPSLPEQKKIAAFLGVVDAKIAALRARRAGLERYKRGLMQALFSQTLRFAKPDGTAFPDWEEKRLGEVFDWVRTNNLSRENLNYDGGEIQNIHYGDIHTKFSATFRQSQEVVPFVSAAAMPKGFTVEEFCKIGDVVIADASEDYADIGKAIEIVELTETPLVAGLHTYIARPKTGLMIGFSGYLLRSAAMRRQIMEIAQGISVLGVSKTNLEKLTLQLPHPEEQGKIANALSAMDAKIAAVIARVAQMEAFKKGLLQQMFV